MTYEIIIDEAQRARIEKALGMLDNEEPVLDDGTLETFGVVVLFDMFRKLPQDEHENPGTTHGFAL